MHFKRLPNNLKPREKALEYGVSKLSDIELLALFIRNGSSKEDVLNISKKVISTYGNLNNLKHTSINELRKINGIGIVKSIEILALFEFARRISFNNSPNISSDKIAAEVAFNQIGHQNTESFYILYLNKQNQIIFRDTLFKGSGQEVSIDPKEIISIALRKEASKFYCFHNHPSGDLSASEADVSITSRLKHYSSLFGIELIGHLIINSNGEYRKI